MILNHSKLKTFSLLGFIIWLIAAIFFLYEFFLRTFIGTLAHQIIRDLNLNPATFTLLGVVYYLTYGLMQIPVGISTDRYGIKKVLTFAIVICAISSFLFAFSTHFSSAFFSRILMGFGSSFAFVCLLVIALEWFPHRYFGALAGASQFIGTMGPLLAGGPFIFFVMQLNGNWRLALIIIGIIGIFLALLSLIFVKNKSHLDTKQSLIVLKREEPFLNVLKQLLHNKQAWYIALYSASIYLPMALLGALWGTNYLQTRGVSQNIAADVISIGWLGYAIGCPLLGALSDFIRRRKFALILPAIIATIVTTLITYATFNFTIVYGILFFILGLAAGGQSVGFAIIAEHVSIKARATALGLNNSMMLLFSTFFPLIAGYFIHRASIYNQIPNVLEPSNFFVAFSIMPILGLCASLISLFLIKETYCRPQKTTVILETDHTK